MSTHPLVPRALAAVVIAALLACGPAQPTPANVVPANGADGDSSGGSIANMLMKKFPGVIITQESGGGLRILLRGGGGSFYGGSEPLYIIDDVPMPEGSGGLITVNPYDIQRIEVLKNPADIGIYGMRGSNGVVKITTKHAH